jgi:hypothetical protein
MRTAHAGFSLLPMLVRRSRRKPAACLAALPIIHAIYIVLLGLVILLSGCTAVTPHHASPARGSSAEQFRAMLIQLADA